MKKDVNNYEGLYAVDENGNVYSLGRIVERNGIGKGGVKCKPMLLKDRVLKKYIAKNGYPVVNLHKNGVSKQKYVHDLVANAFLGEKPFKNTVNHIDGNKENCHVSNLEYCTYLENNLHAKKLGLNKHCVTDVIKRVRVIAIKNGIEVARFTTIKEAQNALNCKHIGCVIKGKRKSANGYTFSTFD